MSEEINNEIDLIEILKRAYRFKKNIIFTTIIFGLIGIAIALLSPVSYSSSTVFIPQSQEMNSSSLSGVANLVGINLSSSSNGNEIPSSMYPLISNSTNFKRLLLRKKINQNNDITLKQFIINHYNLEEEIKHDNLSKIHVSKLEEKCFEILSKMISVSVNQKDGYITITATMPIAEYSAILANNSKDILQQIIIDNKIESASQNLRFSQKQLKEKRIEFEEIQNKLSYFKESNLNLVNSLRINQQDKLEAEFQIINAVVTELSKQVEKEKLQVTKDTPVFSTIKEAVIPNIRTSPKRKEIVIIYSFIGFILSLTYNLSKDYLLKIIYEVKNN